MNKNTSGHSEETIDFKTLFRLFLKRKWWFIGTVILIIVIGGMYVFSKPVRYEVRNYFSFKDDFIEDDYLQYNEAQEIYSRNQSVFIGTDKIGLIFKTDLILNHLNELEEIEDFETDISVSLINLEYKKDSGTFLLRVKDRNKELAKKASLKLIEALGEEIIINDKKIYDNTLELINKDIENLEDEIAGFKDKIVELDRTTQDILALASSPETQNDLTIINGEVLLNKEKIFDNEYEIKRLRGLYQKFLDAKNKVVNRVELLTENPSIDVENNRAINSIIVVLLSIISGIIVVLVVNYIYKLKSK